MTLVGMRTPTGGAEKELFHLESELHPQKKSTTTIQNPTQTQLTGRLIEKSKEGLSKLQLLTVTSRSVLNEFITPGSIGFWEKLLEKLRKEKKWSKINFIDIETKKKNSVYVKKEDADASSPFKEKISHQIIQKSNLTTLATQKSNLVSQVSLKNTNQTLLPPAFIAQRNQTFVACKPRELDEHFLKKAKLTKDMVSYIKEEIETDRKSSQELNLYLNRIFKYNGLSFEVDIDPKGQEGLSCSVRRNAVGDGSYKKAFLTADLEVNKVYTIAISVIIDVKQKESAQREHEILAQLVNVEGCPKVFRIFYHYVGNVLQMGIAMKHYNQKDLFKFVVESGLWGTVSARQKVEMLKDMAKAIRALHLKGILHRDIKLENFLIHWSNKKGRYVVVVNDFGLSLPLSKVSAKTPIVGSPIYEAPEVWAKVLYPKQMEGKVVYGLSSDMFALGITFQGMINNAFPDHADYLNPESAIHPYNPHFAYKLLMGQKEPVITYKTRQPILTELFWRTSCPNPLTRMSDDELVNYLESNFDFIIDELIN